MPSTYTPIATTTLGSAAASVTFNSIANTYTDLIIVCQGVTASGDAYPYVNFNGDTGNNYSLTRIFGDGGTAGSDRRSNTGKADFTIWQTTGRNDFTINVMNYGNTTTFKSALIRANNSSQYTAASVMLWRSTSAITSVTIFAQFVNFAVGSTFTLYGVKSA